MILLDMEIQEVFGGKVLSAFQTAIDMGFVVMDLVVLVRCKEQRLPVWWEGASHLRG